jgi:putative redox protein
VATELSAIVELQEKVRFLGRGHGDQAVLIDYPPPLGDDAGLRGGLQLLLMSLAACMGQTAVPLMRKMRLPLTGCTVEARASRREEHPSVLTEIRLLVTVTGRGLDPAAVRKAVDLAKDSYCPVHAMLQGSTPITTDVRVVEAGSAR